MPKTALITGGSSVTELGEAPRRVPPPAAGARGLRVVHINTWTVAGGAAQVAQRLAGGLRRRGHLARVVAGFGSSSRDSAAVLSAWPRWRHLLRRATLAAEDATGLQYRLIWWGDDIAQHPWVREADVVHVHNLHGGYWTADALPALTQPIVWTLHDMWALTGHCAYSYECERWRNGCGRCPHLDTYPDLWVDRTAHLWRARRRAYHAARLTVVAPSRWLAKLARESPLLQGHPVVHIPNGVDVEQYQPMSQVAARRALGLEPEATVALFVAEHLDDPRKGAATLNQALARLAERWRRSLRLITAGAGAERVAWARGVPRVDLGPLDTVRLREAYAAADMLLCPSEIDNLPNTVLEAAACCTPSVGFAVGGVTDLVRHRETGYAATARDVEALARGIIELAADASLRKRLGVACRKMVVEEFSLEQQITRHLELYRELVAAAHAAP